MAPKKAKVVKSAATNTLETAGKALTTLTQTVHDYEEQLVPVVDAAFKVRSLRFDEFMRNIKELTNDLMTDLGNRAFQWDRECDALIDELPDSWKPSSDRHNLPGFKEEDDEERCFDGRLFSLGGINGSEGCCKSEG